MAGACTTDAALCSVREGKQLEIRCDTRPSNITELSIEASALSLGLRKKLMLSGKSLGMVSIGCPSMIVGLYGPICFHPVCIIVGRRDWTYRHGFRQNGRCIHSLNGALMPWTSASLLYAFCQSDASLLSCAARSIRGALFQPVLLPQSQLGVLVEVRRPQVPLGAPQ